MLYYYITGDAEVRVHVAIVMTVFGIASGLSAANAHSPAAKRAPTAPSSAPHAQHAPPGEDKHGIESENLFGFTLGSDTEHAGGKGVAVENVARWGKRDGRYAALGQKLEFAFGITDHISVSFGLFTDYHRVSGVTGFEDARGYDFNGVGGEVRWRLLERGPSPIGLTLHIEPNAQRYDELTGLRASKLGSENKLIIDAELVPERVFAAFNLLHEVEQVREKGSEETERGSKIGAAVAASVQIAPQTFIGAELRYLRAYEGLALRTFVGDALYAGPTLFWRFAEQAWISGALNVQVAGHEVGGSDNLNLMEFEWHQVRLKVGVEF